MAARTTANLVKQLLRAGATNSDYDGVTDLTIFIRMASRVIDQVVTSAAGDGVTISTETASDMATALAAHRYCQSDRQYASRSTLGASGSFAGQFGLGLDGTTYGQMAKEMDPSGWLDAIAKNNVASMVWLGKTESQALSVSARDGGS